MSHIDIVGAFKSTRHVRGLNMPLNSVQKFLSSYTILNVKTNNANKSFHEAHTN